MKSLAPNLGEAQQPKKFVQVMVNFLFAKSGFKWVGVVGLFMLGVVLITHNTPVVHAGEPTGEIGPMNPTMFKCVSKDGTDLIQPDPFRKPLARVFVKGGVEFPLDDINEILAREPLARQSICTSGAEFDFGFRTEDAVEFNHYLEELEDQCEDLGDNNVIVPITDTRIEGFVYEFHPRDPDNLETTEWFGIPSRQVTVLAKGITFEIFWGSDDNGAYYFNNLGAGPILLNLQLPPDAHMINPNVYLDSSGLEQTLRATLGFYRGDFKPQLSQLRPPDGIPLPLVGLGDIEALSQCGYDDLPAVGASLDPPLTNTEDIPGIPNVGGVLPQDTPISTLIFATVILLALPIAGILKLRQK